MRFADKVCLITGGGSGIGRATCKKFAAEGGRVVVVDNNEQNGDETAQMIAATEGEAIFAKADVSVSSDVQAVVKAAIDKWQRIDILVNNAAVMAFKRVVDLGEDEWDRVLDVNLRAVFLFCKYCLPYMERGAIINVSSVHAHKTEANVAPYAASKGGMEALTRALSCEYPPSQIRINCIAPGGVNTSMFWSNPGIKRVKSEKFLYSQPEQIASVICFLASEDASAINGATLVVDKGLISAI